ncbi:MAG TPA: TRAP transporter small permease [Burkholderiaceae bacterium]|nr:TRAP transporter small permease [Burkholderiaceae bacterium]HQR70309.1 TRAP transporter small permease [Burkholderiaceae bacterium]
MKKDPGLDVVGRLLRRLAQTFALTGATMAGAVGLMTVASVAGRALFTQPIPGDVELTQFGIALAISLSLGWCQLQGSNIIVDFFTDRLSVRPRQWLDASGALLLGVMCALLAWRAGAGAVAVREAGETSMILALPMWWAYASLAPGLALSALIAAYQAVMLALDRPLAALQGRR